jgi:hypothetical protein
MFWRTRGLGGCGGRGGFRGCGGVLEDPLPLRLGLHFHREITLSMGDPGRVGIEINLLYMELFSFHIENL